MYEKNYQHCIQWIFFNMNAQWEFECYNYFQMSNSIIFYRKNKQNIAITNIKKINK